MTRAELADAVYKIIYFDMAGTKSSKEIWETIAKANDAELNEFILTNWNKYRTITGGET